MKYCNIIAIYIAIALYCYQHWEEERTSREAAQPGRGLGPERSTWAEI